VKLQLSGLPALAIQIGFIVVFSAPVWLAAKIVGAEHPTLIRAALSLIVGAIGSAASILLGGGFALLLAPIYGKDRARPIDFCHRLVSASGDCSSPIIAACCNECQPPSNMRAPLAGTLPNSPKLRNRIVGVFDQPRLRYVTEKSCCQDWPSCDFSQLPRMRRLSSSMRPRNRWKNCRGLPSSDQAPSA
jgi:hypothetical protein